MNADGRAGTKHAPDLPAGGLRRLSQRYADGALSESGYRAARRSFIDRVVAGRGSVADAADGEADGEVFEATQPLPRTLLRRSEHRRRRRSLIALSLVLALGVVVYLAASA